jgi:hypothetical protein
MRDIELLNGLLAAETEEAVIKVLEAKGLSLAKPDPKRWPYLGGMPNNQSIVHAQQSTPTAALVEKFTNGQDALLLRYCKAKGIDPRAPTAPKTMALAIEAFLADKVHQRRNRCEGASGATELRRREPRALRDRHEGAPVPVPVRQRRGPTCRELPVDVLLADSRRKRRLLQGCHPIRARPLQHGQQRCPAVLLGEAQDAAHRLARACRRGGR